MSATRIEFAPGHEDVAITEQDVAAKLLEALILAEQALNAALPCAPLGEPKGTEKQPASDGEWKPLRPGYESRTLAGGATEVRVTPGSLSTAAPAGAPAREPAYQPEGFGYAHVDHRGHQGEVIPKRPELDPGRVMPEDVHGSEPKPEDVPAKWAATEPQQAQATADVPAAPTEWQSGPPPSVGWYEAGMHEWHAYFFGTHWSWYGKGETRLERLAHAIEDDFYRHDELPWRGPRLTGEAWPEPQQ